MQQLNQGVQRSLRPWLGATSIALVSMCSLLSPLPRALFGARAVHRFLCIEFVLRIILLAANCVLLRMSCSRNEPVPP